MTRPRNADRPDGPICRRCSVPLFAANARRSRGRFVGVCRPCESVLANERWRARNPDAPHRSRPINDGSRKYPREVAR